MTKHINTTKYDHDIDIRGEVCPLTFVKSKLALEMIDPGQSLRIVIDYEPATQNVPRSFEAEGHQIVAVTPLDDGEWQIIVRKN